MEDRDHQIELLETELRHWEEQAEVEERAKAEANTKATATISHLSTKLEEARKALQAVKEAPPDQYEECLAELEEDIDDLRDAFKRLDEKAMTGGPPLS
ncbi:MAG TPA: hypothetical protein VM328_00170 [Fimbriimonadaceae bacterium]|nr:hypothetical protein [Fimbriimonadaceae bacterium]